jgi:hypothetical protein
MPQAFPDAMYRSATRVSICNTDRETPFSLEIVVVTVQTL